MRRIVLLSLIPGCLLVGCVSSPLSPQTTSSSQLPRPDQRPEIVGTFEKHRVATQFHAALARNADGDVAGCESLLRQVLTQQPEFHDARLVLADVLLATNRIAEAEEQLRHVVACTPRDAKARYQLGLLLDVQGRSPEALSHLEQAAQLSPANHIYCESFQLAAGVGLGNRSGGPIVKAAGPLTPSPVQPVSFIEP